MARQRGPALLTTLVGTAVVEPVAQGVSVFGRSCLVTACSWREAVIWPRVFDEGGQGGVKAAACRVSGASMHLQGSVDLLSVVCMGRHIDRPAPGRDADRVEPPGTSASDDGWTAELRAACGCSGLLLGLLLVIDMGSGRLTGLRALLWVALAVLLFMVLVPPRVTAGEGWLASRGLLRRRRVRTDCLVGVRWSDGVSLRLVLRDLDGARVEVDPRVLIANPQLWHLLDAGARSSLGRGTLLCGATALRQLSERIDRELAPSRSTRAGIRRRPEGVGPGRRP